MRDSSMMRDPLPPPSDDRSGQDIGVAPANVIGAGGERAPGILHSSVAFEWQPAGCIQKLHHAARLKRAAGVRGRPWSCLRSMRGGRGGV